MSPSGVDRRRRKPWKSAANWAKVFCAVQIPVGFWVGVLTGHPVDPWALAQVSLWTYSFFAPVDAGLLLQSLVALVHPPKPTEAP